MSREITIDVLKTAKTAEEDKEDEFGYSFETNNQAKTN